MKVSRALVSVLAVLSCTLHGASINAIQLDRVLLDAIRAVESNGNICAIGDGGRSLGPYQIMQAYFIDATAPTLGDPTLISEGQIHTDVWGLDSTAYSEDVMQAYMCRYATEARLGHPPTYYKLVNPIAIYHIQCSYMTGSSTKCDPPCNAGQCSQQDDRQTYRCFCMELENEEKAIYGRHPCQDCSIAGIDLVFVLDASRSIGSENFQLFLEFVSTVIRSLDIGPDASQVALIRCSDTASFVFNLTTYDNQDDILSAVSRITYTEGGIFTYGGLYLLASSGFIGARPESKGIPRVAIVVTDTGSDDSDATEDAAASVHAVQPVITVFAVGITDRPELYELSLIASDPDSKFLVTSTGFKFNSHEVALLAKDLKENLCRTTTNRDEKIAIIERPLKKDREVFFEVPIPQDGLTIALKTEHGLVAVCGSTTIETPSCVLSTLYDWVRDVDDYDDIFITAEGQDADSVQDVARRQVSSTNLTVFFTVLGLEENNTFSMNTTLGDTRVPPETPSTTTTSTATTSSSTSDRASTIAGSVIGSIVGTTLMVVLLVLYSH